MSGTITNLLVDAGGGGEATSKRSNESRVPEVDAGPAHRRTEPRSDRLLVLPCSARKRLGGYRELDGPTVLDLLPNRLADRLLDARRTLRQPARVDEPQLLPAWQRYAGTLYDAAGPSLGRALVDGAKVVIISGGYGLVIAEEPVGHYDRRFDLSDWPAGLLSDCLQSTAEALGISDVVSFCAHTTSYARLFRAVPWRHNGITATLVSPDIDGRGGAQVLVPRASGEALQASLDDRLTAGWRSTDGVGITMEPLT